MTNRDPKTGRWAPAPKTKVFVYGTLKDGHRNHHIMGDSPCLGDATTCANFQMIHVGFPVIMEDGDGHPVYGELYECSEKIVQRLDSLEGEGFMYDRKRVQATLATGGPVECSIYVGCTSRWEERFTKANFISPTDQGWLEWNGQHPYALTVGELADEEAAYGPTNDEGEVIKPEDQDQGDVLGLHDERNEP